MNEEILQRAAGTDQNERSLAVDQVLDSPPRNSTRSSTRGRTAVLRRPFGRRTAEAWRSRPRTVKPIWAPGLKLDEDQTGHRRGSVTAQRWARIKGGLRPGIGDARPERPAFLDSACGSDVEFARRVGATAGGKRPAPTPSLHSPQMNSSRPSSISDAWRSGGASAHRKARWRRRRGRVYKARDTRLNVFVAVKLLRGWLPGDHIVSAASPGARTASSLNKPNVRDIS